MGQNQSNSNFCIYLMKHGCVLTYPASFMGSRGSISFHWTPLLNKRLLNFAAGLTIRGWVYMVYQLTFQNFGSILMSHLCCYKLQYIKCNLTNCRVQYHDQCLFIFFLIFWNTLYNHLRVWWWWFSVATSINVIQVRRRWRARPRLKVHHAAIS